MAGSQPIYSAKDEQRLMADLWSLGVRDDPRQFVRYVYPWGKANTPLADRKGPYEWQDQVMLEIAEYYRDAVGWREARGKWPGIFKKAVASGRGDGKSALFSWLAHWMVSTRLGSSVWVSANGEPQLRSKTFPEISKWISMAVNSHWFDVNATSITPAVWFATAVQRDLKIDPKYWYILAQLWSEENPDAFVGAHNAQGEMYLFDEASGIPQVIWTAARGVFTEQTPDRYWLAFSNPRRNDGAFYECFHGEEREEWRATNINALDIKEIAHDEHHAIIRKFGVDSDEAKVEVYGQFPNAATNQFISHSLAQFAAQREVYLDPGAPLILGVDVARSGMANNVICPRKGRDARSIPWKIFKATSDNKSEEVATAVAEMATKLKADGICVDGNGVGGGVVDFLKSWKFQVYEVQSGAQANDDNVYMNKRAEMWGLMKEWLTIGAIPDDPLLKKDLAAPEFTYHATSNKIVLESKEHMLEKRRVASPDRADALSMTFAKVFARNDSRSSKAFTGKPTVARDVEFDLFA